MIKDFNNNVGGRLFAVAPGSGVGGTRIFPAEGNVASGPNVPIIPPAEQQPTPPADYAGIKTFSKLAADDYGEIKTDVYEGLFSNGVGTLTSFFTSSGQSTSQKRYFMNVYNEATSSATTKVQFSIAYGNRGGGGSIFTSDEKPAQATYKKFANLLLDTSVTPTFQFNSASTTINDETIVTLSIKRLNLKDKIDVNNWQLNLVSASRTVKLVDDSSVLSEQVTSVGRKYYNIVSGALVSGQSNPTLYNGTGTYNYYGRVYPELGLVLLSCALLSGSQGAFSANSSSTTTTVNNNENFYPLINTMTFRSQENLYSRYYFCRAKSKEYNFSQNMSYVTSSGTGEVISNVTDRGVPFTYITSVGLYNDAGELLAVAKTSQPIFKEPGVEANFKVRLDF